MEQQTTVSARRLPSAAIPSLLEPLMPQSTVRPRARLRIHRVRRRPDRDCRLTASDGGYGEGFGTSVAISGKTIVVGAQFATVGGNSLQGAAYIFTEPASGWANMTQTAKLTTADGIANNLFGGAVAVSGNTVVVGAVSAGGSNPSPGAAYVFTEPASGWANMTQTAKLGPTDGAVGDDFGSTVSISGNTIVVGAFETAGDAYVFTEPGSGWANMTQTAELTASGQKLNNSVSISGNTIVVGGGGNAYVFSEPKAGWANMTQTAQLSPPEGAGNGDFGGSVSISGNTIMVGAPNATVGDNANQGNAYLFAEPNTGWANMTATAEMAASDGAAKDYFGISVAISGNTLVAGASYATVNGNSLEGAAYVFEAGPAVTGIASTQSTGVYGAGTVIPITVTFSEPVTVTGSPQLALNAGNGARSQL